MNDQSTTARGLAPAPEPPRIPQTLQISEPLEIVVEHDVPSRMRDGVILRANIYRPQAEGSYPVLVSRQPYNKDTNINPVYADPRQLAAAGYLVVMQDVRGRYASEASSNPATRSSRTATTTSSGPPGCPARTGWSAPGAAPITPRRSGGQL